MNDTLRAAAEVGAVQDGRSRRRVRVASGSERPPDLSDEALLDLVQRQTFRYFWDFAHPTSGLARERSNQAFGYGPEVVTTGGSGFGIMTIIVAVERHWISRQEALDRLLQMVRFLYTADSYHGILPHFLNGETGRTIPFTRKDDGGDLVETSFLLAGLLCARQYFDRDDARERELRDRINALWREAEWDWHTQGGRQLLYWHWSPNNGWSINHEIRGWNECLITYVLAASSPHHAIDDEVYHRGWAQAGPSSMAGISMGRSCRSARISGARCSLLSSLPRARPSWSAGPVCRLLAAERRACADQSRALHPQSARLRGLRCRLLGTDLERRSPRL